MTTNEVEIMNEILRFQDVHLTYQAENGEINALNNINFSINEGELVAILGPSGCGKSTMLSLIAGLEKPTTGKIFVAGQEVKGVSAKIGYMLQKDNLLEWRTITSNAYLGLEIGKKLNKSSKAYVDSLLHTYGLADFGKKRPSQLSGGMRQRAALIRTLAYKPDLLLLDEAFSALDYQTRLRAQEDVCNILRQEKKTAIIVTHDISEGITMADRLIVLSQRPGEIKQDIRLEFTASNRRDDPNFRQYFNFIWKELDHNG